jgi:hypothetical protein
VLLYRFNIANLSHYFHIPNFFAVFLKAERSEGVAETEFRFENQLSILPFQADDTAYAVANCPNSDAAVPCYKTGNRHPYPATASATFRRDSTRHIPVSHCAIAFQ